MAEKWIAGRDYAWPTGMEGLVVEVTPWEFLGTFGTQAGAEAACSTAYDFVAPAVEDQIMATGQAWQGQYYPLVTGSQLAPAQAPHPLGSPAYPPQPAG